MQNPDYKSPKMLRASLNVSKLVRSPRRNPSPATMRQADERNKDFMRLLLQNKKIIKSKTGMNTPVAKSRLGCVSPDRKQAETEIQNVYELTVTARKSRRGAIETCPIFQHYPRPSKAKSSKKRI